MIHVDKALPKTTNGRKRSLTATRELKDFPEEIKNSHGRKRDCVKENKRPPDKIHEGSVSTSFLVSKKNEN